MKFLYIKPKPTQQWSLRLFFSIKFGRGHYIFASTSSGLLVYFAPIYFYQYPKRKKDVVFDSLTRPNTTVYNHYCFVPIARFFSSQTPRTLFRQLSDRQAVKQVSRQAGRQAGSCGQQIDRLQSELWSGSKNQTTTLITLSAWCHYLQ
jgi:hypothetical protein